MPDHGPDNLPFDERMHALLDGELSDEERARLEARIQGDPARREALRRAAEIDHALRQAFAPVPPPSDLSGPLPAVAEAGPRPSLTLGIRPGLAVAVAASLLVAAAAAWYALAPTPVIPPPVDRELYGRLVADFRPSVVCDTPEKFVEYTTASLDEPIGVNFEAASGMGIQLIGWRAVGGSYEGVGEARLPRVLLARAPDGTEIVVYFKASHAPAPVHDDAGSIHAFRERFGSVRAYEISPLDTPLVLGLLELER